MGAIAECVANWPWKAIIDLVKSLALPFAAVYVTYKFGKIQADISARQASTAYQAMSIANDKLRLELFEKRFEVYLIASEVINKVVRHGLAVTHDDVEALLEASERADWLFDKFTAGFLADRLFQDAFDLANHNFEIDSEPDSGQRHKVAMERKELKKAFEQHRIELHALMTPYLGFTHRVVK